TNSYSTGAVGGDDNVGGLVGSNHGTIATCYSTGVVSGTTRAGGLVGSNQPDGTILTSFWDVETSGQVQSAGGIGLATAEMQTASTFLEASWDFVDEIENGIDNTWFINEGQDYPRLWWEEPTTPYIGGSGEPNDPYMIGTAEELISLGRCRRDYGKHFILTADIDLNPNLPGREFFVEVAIAPQGTSFTGVFDGNGHTISNLTVGLFGSLGSGAEVRDLGLVDVNISLGKSVGGLSKDNGGIITNCYSTGTITGDELVGGLVGTNSGSIVTSYSSCTVNGTGWYVGGLVGDNQGTITNSYSTGTVSGNQYVGGLVGFNFGGNVINSYSAGSVEPDDINDLKVQHLYVLTRSGILEVSLAGERRLIVGGHYDSYSLDIKDDILYVTEKTSGGDIVAYDLEGRYLRTIPTPPQANDCLKFVVLPDDKFALLGSGKVFFIDYEGNLIATTSNRPASDGIVVDNRLVLSGGGDGQVVEIDLNTYEMSIIKDLSFLPYWLDDIAYANGTYYVDNTNIVYAFTDSGSAVQVAIIQESNITGIVVIEDCAYISVNFAGKVYKVDLSSGETSVLVSGINYPKDIAVSSADRHIGGFIGYNCYGDVINCYWDIETSGQDTTAGGVGKTTTEMQTASTFLDAGWDFVDEAENGTKNIWWINEGQDYPRLWWQLIPEN
ncbi:MAG: GLUG motif-containing protein, partial [Planctomycetota bacterium]